MRTLVLLLPLLSALASGCSPQDSGAAGSAVAQQAPLPEPPQPAPQVTKNDWRKALASAFTENEAKQDEDGLTTFSACFGNTTPKCATFAFGKRDAFRKVMSFEPAGSRMSRFGGRKYLHSYVAVADCAAPMLVLNPSFFSKGGWIFLNRVAVMAEGEVVLDHPFAFGEVKRDNASYGVTEEATWVASDADIAALRKIASAEKLIVRLTGEKGFTTVEKSDLKYFKQDSADAVAIFDGIKAATKDAMPKSCD